MVKASERVARLASHLYNDEFLQNLRSLDMSASRGLTVNSSLLFVDDYTRQVREFEAKPRTGIVSGLLFELPSAFPDDWDYVEICGIKAIRRKDTNAIVYGWNELSHVASFFFMTPSETEHIFFAFMQDCSGIGGNFVYSDATFREVMRNINGTINYLRSKGR
jgi:hypothetical protein